MKCEKHRNGSFVETLCSVERTLEGFYQNKISLFLSIGKCALQCFFVEVTSRQLFVSPCGMAGAMLEEALSKTVNSSISGCSVTPEAQIHFIRIFASESAGELLLSTVGALRSRRNRQSPDRMVRLINWITSFATCPFWIRGKVSATVRAELVVSHFIRSNKVC